MRRKNTPIGLVPESLNLLTIDAIKAIATPNPCDIKMSMITAKNIAPDTELLL